MAGGGNRGERHGPHSPGFSNNRHLLWYAVKNFLASPAAISAS
jgi:hypothetical protein